MRTLAAIVYEPGTGVAVEQLLVDVARQLAARGVRLAGTVQTSVPRGDRCSCDMQVTELSTGLRTTISEDRGPLARGCRLDAQALEGLVGATQAALNGGTDLLIVNKFGKREAEGAGFRPVIAAALADGLPVLVAVNRAQLEHWHAFVADLAEELPPARAAIEAWCASVLAPAGVSVA